MTCEMILMRQLSFKKIKITLVKKPERVVFTCLHFYLSNTYTCLVNKGQAFRQKSHVDLPESFCTNHNFYKNCIECVPSHNIQTDVYIFSLEEGSDPERDVRTESTDQTLSKRTCCLQ